MKHGRGKYIRGAEHLTLAPPNYQMAGQAFLDLDMRSTPLLFMDDRSPSYVNATGIEP